MSKQDSYESPEPGVTYVSPRLPAFHVKERPIRIATRANSQSSGYEYGKEKGEVVLRHKEDAATCITAKFMEDSKGLTVLTIQKFRPENNEPYGSGFSFVGEEIVKLLEFIDQIRSIDLGDGRPRRIPDAELKRLALSSSQAKALMLENEDLFAELVRSSITSRDVVAVAYRKRQIDVFHKLLNDPSYFDTARKKYGKPEDVWQRFFERNSWIFGYGLSLIYVTELENKKLEQFVSGFDISGPGKRTDALLKTRGALSSLCFAEIKTHETPLLAKKSYRSGCWSPSKDLAGGISQVQGTVAEACQRIQSRLLPTDSDGNPSGEELFLFQPRSYLIVGSLKQFSEKGGVNTEKLRSFELLRRNTVHPEVVTFDELYERAKFIVEADKS
jgi:hypothetical protein